MNLQYKYIGSWVVLKKAPICERSREDAEKRFHNQHFAYLGILKDDAYIGYIEYGKSQESNLDIRFCFLDSQLNKTHTFFFESQKSSNSLFLIQATYYILDDNFKELFIYDDFIRKNEIDIQDGYWNYNDESIKNEGGKLIRKVADNITYKFDFFSDAYDITSMKLPKLEFSLEPEKLVELFELIMPFNFSNKPYKFDGADENSLEEIMAVQDVWAIKRQLKQKKSRKKSVK